MIRSFGNKLAEDLYDDKQTNKTRRFDNALRRIARRKLLYLHDAAQLGDLRVPPGNRLEALKGDWQGYHALRINDQWRVFFRWDGGHAHEVQIIDYH